MVVRCIRSLVILASVIRYVGGLLNIPEYHNLIAVVEYVGAHYGSNGMCARFVAHANILSRDLLRDVMSNRHRSRDREERVVYIYLSDLVFFRWTKSYLSHLICHPCATNLSHIQGVQSND